MHEDGCEGTYPLSFMIKVSVSVVMSTVSVVGEVS